MERTLRAVKRMKMRCEGGGRAAGGAAQPGRERTPGEAPEKRGPVSGGERERERRQPSPYSPPWPGFVGASGRVSFKDPFSAVSTKNALADQPQRDTRSKLRAYPKLRSLTPLGRWPPRELAEPRGAQSARAAKSAARSGTTQAADGA